MQPMLFLCFIAYAGAGLVTPMSHADPVTNRIVIENYARKNVQPDSIQFSSTGTGPADRKKMTIKQLPKNGLVKWVIESEKPIILSSTSLFGELGSNLMMEAGDSIRIENTNGKKIYSGKGAGKFNLLTSIHEKLDSVTRPSNPKYYTALSLTDYIEWHHYLNKKEEIVLHMLDSGRSMLSETAFHHIKYTLLVKMEDRRVKKFGQLRKHHQEFNLQESDLCMIFDSSLNNNASAWLVSLTKVATSSVYYYEYIRTLYNRNHEFVQADSIRLSPYRKLAYYNLAKEKLRGGVLGLYLSFLIPKEVLKEQGYDLTAIKILEDFYQYPGLEQHQAYVRQQERMINQNNLKKGSYGTKFNLPDVNGKMFSTEQLKGKIVVLYFPRIKTAASGKNATQFPALKNEFREDSSILFISIRQKMEGALPDNSNVFSEEHYNIFKRVFEVNENPKYHIIGPDGKSIASIEAEADEGACAAIVRKHLHAEMMATANDGPYVIHRGDSVKAYYLNNKNISSSNFPANSKIPLHITVNENHKIIFKLKEEHLPEPYVFEKPEKLLVISDIEGNFPVFTELLKANGVIDSSYNWTFGKNHLVLNGDFFDRGNQVTECLWLIYALEQSAKEAGGYVHFILGNHEMMNLVGDTRYVHKKYIRSASRLNIPYGNLLSENSELGKWLRTKNIVEKIGDILFVHGGISPEVNALNIPLDQINEIVRRYCTSDSFSIKTGDHAGRIIIDSDASPMWYRKYYKETMDPAFMMQTIQATLEKYGVNKIITGHTVVSSTITVHHQGKIINTDTPHARGASEALLITGDKYFRTSMNQSPVQL